MFGRKHRGLPEQPFAHSDTCGIVRADPDVRIEWQRIEGRRWQRVCECGNRGLARARTRTSSARPPRSEDQPPRRAVRVRVRDRCRRSQASTQGQGRHGRGLLVGGVRRMRLLLGGAALRRGERGVTRWWRRLGGSSRGHLAYQVASWRGIEDGPCDAPSGTNDLIRASDSESKLSQTPRSTVSLLRRFRQPIATHGNGFGLFSWVSRGFVLPLIATGCNHGAP